MSQIGTSRIHKTNLPNHLPRKSIEKATPPEYHVHAADPRHIPSANFAVELQCCPEHSPHAMGGPSWQRTDITVKLQSQSKHVRIVFVLGNSQRGQVAIEVTGANKYFRQLPSRNIAIEVGTSEYVRNIGSFACLPAIQIAFEFLSL